MKDEKHILDIVNMSALAAKVGVSRQALAYSREHGGPAPKDSWYEALMWLQDCSYTEFLNVVVWARLPAFLDLVHSWPTLQKRVRENGTREQRALKMALMQFQGVGELVICQDCKGSNTELAN